MKKAMSVFLIIVITFSLTACGGNNTSSSDNAADNGKIVIRLGTATEPSGSYVMGAKEFEKKVEEYTDGKVDVQIFPSGQLGSERDLIEGVSLGTLEMTISSTGPLPNFSKEFQLFDLPFLVTDVQKAYEVMDGEIGQKILASLEPSGIKALGFWENGFRHISNNKREIVTPDDIAGLKLRTMENPIHMATFEALKALPTPMAWGEVYTALEQGTVDGQENPLIIFETNKLYETQKYLSLTGHVYSPAVMLINKATFEGYPQDVQDAIIKAEKEARVWERNFNQEKEAELVDAFKEKGVVVTEVDKELWKKATEPIYEKYKNEINQEYIKALQ